MEGWEFIMAGGGLYNNLDYSFAVGNEDGSFAVPPKSPGGGNRAFRGQMKVLSEFIHSFDFLRMSPDESVVKGGLPPKSRARALSQKGKQYAVYIFGGPETKLELALPAGRYKAEWIETTTGKVLLATAVNAVNPVTELQSPKYNPDIGLRVTLSE